MTINLLPVIIVAIIVIFIIFLLSKPKATKVGFDIMVLNLKVLLRNPQLFLFPIFLSLFVGFMIFYLVVSMPYIISMQTASNSLLLALAPIINFVMFFVILILGGNFIMIIFYRYVLNIICVEQKMSLIGIIKNEFSHFWQFLKLSMALFSIRLTFYMLQRLLRFRMYHEAYSGYGNAWGTYGQMIVLGFVNQTLVYAPIDYAIYKSSPKEAITKSYEINKNWTAINIALHFISFLPIMIFFVAGLILLSNNNELIHSIGLSNPTMFWQAFSAGFIFFITSLLYTIPSFSLAISLIAVYILYNNAYQEGKLEVSENDFGFPSIISYLDLIGEKIAGYIDFSTDRQYDHIPLKEEYNKDLIIK